MKKEIGVMDLPKVLDPRGNLTYIQNADQIPFSMQRVFWTYDVPGGEKRGGHAYFTQEEVIVALSGSFDVVVTDMTGTVKHYPLNRSYFGLYLPPLTWRHMENFSSNSLALHISSMAFSAKDYIYDFAQYIYAGGGTNHHDGI
jgi:hypothetical protein